MGKKRSAGVNDIHDGALVEIELVSEHEITLWFLTNSSWTKGQSWRVGARISRIQNAREARAWFDGLKRDDKGRYGSVLGLEQREGCVALGLVDGSFLFLGAKLSEV